MSDALNPAVTSIARARRALLWQLDKLFPPDPRAFLDAHAQTDRSMSLAPRVAGTYLAELPSSDVDILDFGCGWGGETLWLAHHSRSVTGVDINASAIEHANEAQRKAGVENCAFVHAASSALPLPDSSFDAVFSTNVFEHVMDLEGSFRELYRVLRPGGLLLSRFGPLFLSPQGYHLYWACQVPYAHLLFGLEAVLELRNARCDSPRAAASWQDLGLNGRRFRDFKRAALSAGFQLERFKRIPVRRLSWLAAIHTVGDLLTFGIDMRLRRPH